MNFKEAILPLSFALITTFAIQYFFFSKQVPETPTDSVRSGQSFQALAHEAMVKPLNTEIDFVDDTAQPIESTVIKTPHYTATFSSANGALEQLAFKHMVNGKHEELITLVPPESTEREKSAFIVALNADTPYFYKLDNVIKQDKQTIIAYSANAPAGHITKQYIIHDDTYALDLKLTITPKNTEQGVQPRIFIPGPELTLRAHLPETQAVVYSAEDKLRQTKFADLTASTVWASPTLFGIEDRYFIHTLVRDDQRFTQRAYYKIAGQDALTAILEGPVIKEPTTWHLTFYCGPKEADSMAAVDSRLEGTLAYGWLSPLAKLLMKILKAIYNVVHNYGLAIIIITFLVNLALMPLTMRSTKHMQNQTDYYKKRQYIEQKYRNDPERLAFERQELLKKQASSMDFSIFATILVQAPLFFALNRVINNSIELYHAPFLWVPDLSLKDPYYILPAIFAIVIIIRTIVTATSTDPRQLVASMFIVLLFAGIIGSWLSAGLALFSITIILSGVVQTYVQKVFKL